MSKLIILLKKKGGRGIIVTQPCPSGMLGYYVLSCAHVAVPNTHVKDEGKTTLSKEVRRLLLSHRDLSGQKARWTSARATRRKGERETKQHPMYIDMHLTLEHQDGQACECAAGWAGYS